MSEQENKNPESWKVDGNIAPEDVSYPSVVDVFTVSNCTVELEPATTVDGNLLIPVKSTTDF